MTQRTVDDLRRLVEANVMSEELFELILCDYRAVSTCWCGHDMVEHDFDEYVDGVKIISPIQDHVFHSCGTKRIAYLVEFDQRGAFAGIPFEHDHSDEWSEASRATVESICLLCRIEAWESSDA